MTNVLTSLTAQDQVLKMMQIFQACAPNAESFGDLCYTCNNYFTVPVHMRSVFTEVSDITITTHCQYCYAAHLNIQRFKQYFFQPEQTA